MPVDFWEFKVFALKQAENEFLQHNPINPLQIYYGRFVLWGSKNHTYCPLKGIVGVSNESVCFVVSWKSFLSIQETRRHWLR